MAALAELVITKESIDTDPWIYGLVRIAGAEEPQYDCRFLPQDKLRVEQFVGILPRVINREAKGVFIPDSLGSTRFLSSPNSFNRWILADSEIYFFVPGEYIFPYEDVYTAPGTLFFSHDSETTLAYLYTLAEIFEDMLTVASPEVIEKYLSKNSKRVASINNITVTRNGEKICRSEIHIGLLVEVLSYKREAFRKFDSYQDLFDAVKLSEKYDLPDGYDMDLSERPDEEIARDFIQSADNPYEAIELLNLLIQHGVIIPGITRPLAEGEAPDYLWVRYPDDHTILLPHYLIEEIKRRVAQNTTEK